MARYRGPKNKYLERFGLISQDKSGRKKKKYARKKTDYGLQLEEKQKLKFIYSIMERQLKKYAMEAKKSKEPPGEFILRKLETRLDNVVYRLGFSPTRRGARQLVSHNHVLINGKKVNIPSYNVSPGEKISLRGRMAGNAGIRESLKNKKPEQIPGWLKREKEGGVILRNPDKDELGKETDISQVVEFYR